MPLPDYQQQLWIAYIESERVRVRQESLDVLQRFIQSLGSLPTDQWQGWALNLARQVERGVNIPVRIPLFRFVLFPALYAELLSGAAAPVRMLAGLTTYLDRCSDCRGLLPEEMQSRSGLLKEAIRRDPEDAKSMNELLRIFDWRFEYALHELPTGVLYGINGATIDQCTEMLEELCEYQQYVAQARTATEDQKRIAEAFFHITAYRDYLTKDGQYANYESYLSHHHTQTEEPMP